MWLMKAPPELSGPSGQMFGHQVIQGHVLVDTYDSFYWLRKKGFTDVTPDGLRPLRTPPDSLLLIRHGGLGDMLVVTALAKRIKHEWPGCVVTIACTTPYIDLLRNNPNIDTYVKDWLITDVSRNVELFSDTWDLTHSVEFNVQACCTDYYTLALRTFGFEPDPEDLPRPEIYLTTEEKNRAKRYLTDKGFLRPRRQLLGLALRASYEPRSISLTRVLEFVDYLAAQPDLDVILYGHTMPTMPLGRYTCATCQHVGHAFFSEGVRTQELKCPGCEATVQISADTAPWASNVFNMGISLPVREMAATVAMLDGLISVDTGVAHVGAAFAVPQVLLTSSWDGHSPAGTWPRTRVIQKPYPCAPCFSHLGQCRRASLTPGNHPPCMNQFRPEEAWASVQALLAQGNAYTPRPVFDLDLSIDDLRMRRPCPYCDNDMKSAPMKARKGRFAYYACPGCGSLLLNRVPNARELAAFYSEPIYEQGFRDPTVWQISYDNGQQMLNTLNSLLPPAMRPGRVVDFGAATGRELTAFSEAAWDTWAVDASPEMLRIAAQESKVAHTVCADVAQLMPAHPSVVGGTEPLRLAESVLLARTNSITCVIASHLIEHLADPRPFLRQITKILEPRGYLILAAPIYDVKRMPNPMTWLHINCFSAGEHVSIPSLSAFQRLVQESGLVIRAHTPQHPDSVIYFCEKTLPTPLDPNEVSSR